jgi:hypothetical protein
MQAVEFLDRALHRRLHRCIVGDVQRDADGLCTGAAQLRHGGIHRILLQVPDRNTGTGCGQRLRHGQADAGHAAGHDRGLAGELVINHLHSPSVGVAMRRAAANPSPYAGRCDEQTNSLSADRSSHETSTEVHGIKYGYSMQNAGVCSTPRSTWP